MNKKELEIAIIRSGLSKNDVIEKTGISRKAFYARLKGSVQFKQNEIAKLKEVLNLSDDDIISIFFN